MPNPIGDETPVEFTPNLEILVFNKDIEGNEQVNRVSAVSAAAGARYAEAITAADAWVGGPGGGGGTNASFENSIEDLPNGTIVSTHGGASDTLVPAWRDGVGMVSVLINEGAFLAADPELAPTTITAATYTVLASDHGKRLRFSHATPAITIGTQAAQSYPDGFWFEVRSINAYTVTCATGVTGNGVSAKVFSGLARPKSSKFEKTSTDAWDGLGDIT